MVKVKVTDYFHLGRFNELRNIVRQDKDEQGMLFPGDIFECTEEMADYLTGKNPLNKSFVTVIEVIPEVISKAIPEVIPEEEKPKTTKKTTKKTSKKK